MDRRAAKELLHIEGWLARVAEIVGRGRQAYLDDVLLQEAGDSLMMKLGEAPIGSRVWTCWLRRVSSGPWRWRIGTS
jgi:hypothetical protein